MTKAKTDPNTRGLDVERSFFNLAEAWLAGEGPPEKRTALYSAASMLAQVLLQRHWRPTQLYLCAQRLVTSTEVDEQRQAVTSALNVLGAGVPELSETLDLHALAVVVTRILRDAGFTTPQITELVDDGRAGNNGEQRLARTKSRYKRDVTQRLHAFWSTAFVKGNPGTPNSR